MSLKQIPLKDRYKSYTDDLAADFLAPALGVATGYDRMVGYFSSASFEFLRDSLEHFVNRSGRIRLIIGEPLSEDEYEAVAKGTEQLESKVVDRVLSELTSDAALPKGLTPLRLLSWLVAHDRLEIRFAGLSSSRSPFAMMHEKVGILRDDEGNVVVFSGSANETVYALLPGYNREKIDVYWNWDAGDSYERHAQDEVEDFEAAWSGSDDALCVVPIPSAAYDQMVLVSDKLGPDNPFSNSLKTEEIDLYPKLPDFIGNRRYDLQRHQKESLLEWRKNEFQGVFALCTGSGKTIMALHAATRIAAAHKEADQPLAVVVAVPFQVLAEQWAINMALFGIEPIRCWGGRGNWESELRLRSSSFGMTKSPSFLPILVVNKTLKENEAFQRALERIPSDLLLFIGDECHHHSNASWSIKIPQARYKMGLSATPWNKNRDEERAFVTSIYSETVAFFGLQDALDLDVLCKYSYEFSEVYLDEIEWDEYLDRSRKIASELSKSPGERNQNNLDIWRGERARIVGSCKHKFETFAVEDVPNLRPKSLVYVGDGSVQDEGPGVGQSLGELRDIARASRLLSENGFVVQRITASESARERSDTLVSFSEGLTNPVVAIRVLDEGFDLPDVQAAYLLASSRSERQFVQRRGRILRKSEGKEIAYVKDFLVMPPQGEISASAQTLVRDELIRAFEFAKFAVNSVESLGKIGLIADSLELDMHEVSSGTSVKEDYM